MRKLRLLPLLAFFVVLLPGASLFAQYQDKVPQALASFPDLRVQYGGAIGAQIQNTIANWVVRAPKANPAMLSVLQLRERAPKASQYYVPWVGEFVGKYLENAILLMQTTNDPELAQTVDAVVRSLIACQDRDGYLGPYSKDERLVVCWDLWGHYHAMTALMLYYERTGNADALEAARRAGMLVEKIFFHPDANGVEKRVQDVGSDEVNYSIVTALCQLYRLTNEEHYLQTAYKILDDLKARGDFYRQGLAGTEFFRTPQPRWESLHTILALAEFYRIDGDETYKRAFLNLWESVRKRDVHNNGSFSCGEQAIGSPFKEGAIETCCTVAWTALTVEALRVSADPRCADALENTLYNAVAAYTHPSGAWCAYDTPMNGRRDASYRTIVFQSRPGQPELNCCSVNSPRGFAELVDWALMKGKDEQGQDSVYLNYYGEGVSSFRLGKRVVTVKQTTGYPADGRVHIEVASQDDDPIEFTLFVRVPQWVKEPTLTFLENDADNGDEPQALTPGEYYPIRRAWKKGDAFTLNFPMELRYASGDADFSGKLCVYYGPLLLAYDQFFNQRETDDIPTISPKSFENAKIELVGSGNPNAERVGFFAPQIFVKLDAADPNDGSIFLTDFATAGSLGTSYASWLPGKDLAPPVPACDQPQQDANVAPGAIPFAWRKVANAEQFQFKVVVASAPDFMSPIFEATSTNGKNAIAAPDQTNKLEPNTTYYWKIVAENEFGTTESLSPGRRFQVDPNLPEFDYDAHLKKQEALKSSQTLIEDKLDGTPSPTTGVVKSATNLEQADGAVKFNGTDSKLVYQLDAFPAVQYEATLEFTVDGVPTEGYIAQIISAWTKSNDDPLRVAIDREGKLYGAVEGKRGGMTPHVPIEQGVPHKLRVVKESEDWTIYLDDKELGSLAVEEVSTTESLTIGLGCNPNFVGEPEFFNGRIANFKLTGVCEAP